MLQKKYRKMRRCPTLKELPPPPPDKIGWPWTEGSRQLPDTLPDGAPWPKISIVTPSLNQGQFIEETIRSVLLQGYPNFEYIIIDGVSTDGTIDIIKKYEKWLFHFVSEPDFGQSNAINKGLSFSSGNIAAWINSDDYYLPNAFNKISETYAKNKCNLIGGNIIVVDNEKCTSRISIQSKITHESLLQIWLNDGTRDWNQPGIFFSKELLKKVGGLRESLNYSMDFDLFCRMLKHSDMRVINNNLALFRIHKRAKTYSMKEGLLELSMVALKYINDLESCKKIEYKTNFSLYILKRSKLYFSQGDIIYFLKYFLLSLRNGFVITIKSLIILIIRKSSLCLP